MRGPHGDWRAGVRRTLTFMSPSLTGLVSDAVNGALALPSIPLQLARIADATDVLPEVRRELTRVAEATDMLPGLRQDMARVAEATEVLPAVLAALEKVAEQTAVLADIDEHTTHIERMLPALVELERSLPELTPAIARLTGPIEQLLLVLDHLDTTMSTLVHVVEPLQGPAERFGRFAGRFPRRSNGRGGDGATPAG